MSANDCACHIPCRSCAGSLLDAPDVQPIKPFELQ